MPTLDFPDGAISYDVHGDGPPVVILRGLARSVSHWLGYEHELAKRFRVVTLDLRGVGKTTREWDVTTSIEHMADDVVAVLDALKIERAHICGVSLGGMVTLAVGLRHPARCLSLVTVNTSIGGTRHLRLTPRAVGAIVASVFQPVERSNARLVDVLVGGSCPADRRAEIASRYEAITRAEGLYGRTAVKQLLAAGRFLPIRRLKTLKVPSLIVYGTDDRFVPNINSRRLAQYIPGATLVPIEGGGHELTLDKPQELAEVLAGWVFGQKVPASRRDVPSGTTR